MAGTGGGAIVATASVAGLVGYTPAPMYTATKAAVIGWARAMAPALAADGITIDAICPGGVATPMTGRSADQADDQILAPTALAAEMIAVGLDDGSGRAVSVVAGRDPLAQAYEFPPVAGFG